MRRAPLRAVRRLPARERRVRLWWTPDRLRRVVDQDVQRLALLPQLLAQAEDLARVTQVHCEDREPVQPLLAARHRAEAPLRVVRESAGDQEFRAVAQHHQGQLEADLHSAPGEQRAASAQIRAERAAGAVVGGAAGTEPVVEGVDLSIRCLADIAGPWPPEDSAGAFGAVRRDQRRVLTAVVGPGRGGRHHGRVGGGEFGPARLAPAQPSVTGEERGDLLGAQPHRVVDRQRAEPADHVVEDREVRLADPTALAHPSRPARAVRSWPRPDSNRRIRHAIAASLPLLYRTPHPPGPGVFGPRAFPDRSRVRTAVPNGFTTVRPGATVGSGGGTHGTDP